MPILTKPPLTIDYADDGQGAPVLLIHSSVSGNRQWRALTDALADRYRVLAINLYGYGETTPWPADVRQTLDAQARLVVALCEALDEPLHLVGHSFGGSVALKATSLMGARVASLVLLEPNPFHLLRRHGRGEAWQECCGLRDHVKRFGTAADWPRVAERFADYWLGDGSWRAMPEKRRAAFAESLPPNFHEWDAVMDEKTPIGDWAKLAARTLVVSDPATRLPIREIIALFAAACPHWTFRTISGGGHMAPLTRPDLVDPIVREFLDAGSA
jgi:pimeloyl-ACP methyl ester carboxylesterase